MIKKENLNTTHQTYWMTCLFSNYAVCCSYFTQKNVSVFFEDYFKEFEKDFADPKTFFNNKYIGGFLNEQMFAQHYFNQFSQYLYDYQNYINGQIDIDYFMKKYAPIFTVQFHIRTYSGFIPYLTNQTTDLGGYPFIKLLHDNIFQTNIIECRNHVRVISTSKDENDILTENDLKLTTGNELIEYMKNEDMLINAYDTVNDHSLTVYCDLNTKLFFVHNTNDPSNDKSQDENWVDSYRHFLIYKRIK